MMEERFKRGEQASLVGVFGNFALSAVKIVIGFISGSTAVVSDGLHTFSDVLASAITYLGIKISRKPADESHPFGHYDAEAIAGLLVSIALVLLAFEFMRYALSMLFNPPEEVGGIALLAVVLTVAVKEPMARYTLSIADKIGSPALQADARHHRSDVYTSSAVLVGVVGSMAGYPFLDPLVGIAISVLIFWTGVEIGWKNINALMGTVPSRDYVERIQKRAKAVEGVRCAHRVRVYTLGAFTKLDLHICVEEDLPLKEAHRIAHQVQGKLTESMPEVITALVHVEPFDLHHRLEHE